MDKTKKKDLKLIKTPERDVCPTINYIGVW